jgi:hypothetical protein
MPKQIAGAPIIGRKTELKTALKALQDGKHIFVQGPYGIGKTTFGLALLAMFGGPRLRISLAGSPSDMAAEIIQVLANYKPPPRPQRSTASAIYFYDRRTRIRSFRVLKNLMIELCVYRFPILVDDFRKISISKLAFVNMLASMGFRIILAVDSGYDQKNIESLTKSCLIHSWINLPRLSNQESKDLIYKLLNVQNIVVEPRRVDFWVKTLRGYPLQIVEHTHRFSNSHATEAT